MDHRAEVMDLLRIRRNRITPEQAGIIVGGCRRVPGLRREEVASLTGNSVEYYSRMERGDLKGVSLDVLDSLARALQLNEAEIDHFADLAKAATPVPLRHRHDKPTEQVAAPTLQRFLDAIMGVPKWVRGPAARFRSNEPVGSGIVCTIIRGSRQPGQHGSVHVS